MLCPQTQFAKECFFRLCPRQFEGHQHGGAVQQTWEPPSCLWPRHSSQTHRHVTQICVYTHSEANMETSLTWCSHQGLGWGNGETKPCVTKSCHKISYEILPDKTIISKLWYSESEKACLPQSKIQSLKHSWGVVLWILGVKESKLTTHPTYPPTQINNHHTHWPPTWVGWRERKSVYSGVRWGHFPRSERHYFWANKPTMVKWYKLFLVTPSTSITGITGF